MKKLFITTRSLPSLTEGCFINHSATHLPRQAQIAIACRLCRRDLGVSIVASAPLLHLITNTPFKAIAEEPTPPTDLTTDSPPITKKPPLAFLDVSIDGQQVGRITIAIDESEAPSGQPHFREARCELQKKRVHQDHA